ncbi:UNVERIFIED_CONTAM: hypothetical protein FKN15_051073 [Acipenser sinensis]
MLQGMNALLQTVSPASPSSPAYFSRHLSDHTGVNKIIEGKDVNLVLMLIATSELIDQRNVSCGNVSVTLKSNDPCFLKNLTMGEFVTAFSAYTDVLCSAFPHRREELNHYLARLIMQQPKSYSVGGQCRSREATGKPAGTRPDYRGRWCTVSRGHPHRPNPPSPRTTLGQLCAAPWELQSSIGKGIAWIHTRDLQAIERILHSRGAPLLE